MNSHLEITALLEKKQARRWRLAKLSFEEKIEIIERLRELEINRSLMRTRQKARQKDEDGRMKEE